MFDSGIAAAKLVEGLKNEVDVAIPISDTSYIVWLNSLEQLLYSEFVQEQRELVVDKPDKSVISLGDIEVSEGENGVSFEDIYTVYADNTQLIKSTVASGEIFPNTFYKKENNMGYNVDFAPRKLRIIYFVKPAIKKVNIVDEKEEIGNGNVMVPIEFIDLVKAKLRGEAYKVANEDALAAKWINDYNILLETFKAWIGDKSAKFGL